MDKPIEKRRRFLPPLNSLGYHVLLTLFAVLVLGPLGALVGAFMLFSLGFSVGGQVLAGILGSAVTFGYGSEGKHGANYMQTAAASVTGMGALAVLLQARAWLGLPATNNVTLFIYLLSIGIFGVSVGMLYTPLVVDRMQLKFPSGLAVANILRALTDPKLLKTSIAKLGSGTGIGFVMGIATDKLGTSLGGTGLSMSTLGAGMLVGARITIPALLTGVIGVEISPWLEEIGWLSKGEPFRKIGFVIALGMILGAAAVDIVGIGIKAVAVAKQTKGGDETAPDWKKTNKMRLALWIVGSGATVFMIGTQMLGLPSAPLLLVIALVFGFVLVNGISMGISDANPVSAAFVIGVFLMATIGLSDPGAGLMCAAVPLIACSVGVDMQQDRSTGWRLGTNRVIQFRYQLVGLVTGALLCIFIGEFFLKAFPELQVNQFGVESTSKWSSAFTYKLVGAIKGLTNPNPHFTKALTLGIGIGLTVQVLRILIKQWRWYGNVIKTSKIGYATGFVVDALVLPSPYASSFGGFVPFPVALWFGVGGIMSSFGNMLQNEARRSVHIHVAATEPQQQDDEEAGKEEMSTISLVGGGLIAGEALCALVLALFAVAKIVG